MTNNNGHVKQLVRNYEMSTCYIYGNRCHATLVRIFVVRIRRRRMHQAIPATQLLDLTPSGEYGLRPHGVIFQGF